METLNVKGMVKNHCLAQSISDAGWSSFVTKLEYKADWLGKTILRIGRFEPSSEICNVCGYHSATRSYVMNCVKLLLPFGVTLPEYASAVMQLCKASGTM